MPTFVDAVLGSNINYVTLAVPFFFLLIGVEFVAGLLQNNTAQDIREFPWLADLPIIGALFRSTEFSRDETELVILVTPYLVRPAASATALALPTDGFRAPTDAGRVLAGEAWQQRQPARPVPATPRLAGPVGFIVD